MREIATSLHPVRYSVRCCALLPQFEAALPVPGQFPFRHAGTLYSNTQAALLPYLAARSAAAIGKQRRKDHAVVTSRLPEQPVVR